MASITVNSDGYWGDDTILAAGSWSNLVWNDVVTVSGNVTCTIDPSVHAATKVDAGIQLTVNGTLNILNSSNTTALLHMGPSGTSKRMTIGYEGKVFVSGSVIQIGIGNGTPNQVLTGWTTAGFDPADEPSHVEVYNQQTSAWDVWMNIGAPTFSLLTKAGTGECGRWFEYNTTTGAITFGDDGKPVNLSSGVVAGASEIIVTNTTNYASGDWIHVIDSSVREPHPIQITQITSNTLILDRPLYYDHLTASGAYIRKTNGGNILPSGAAVRVYNIGIGSIDNTGARVLSTNSSTSDYGLYTVSTAAQVVDWSNLYCFGFYSNFRYFPSIKQTNVGIIQGQYINGNTEIILTRLVKTCTGKYNTSNAWGMYTANPTWNITLNDCYFTGNSTYHACNLGSIYILNIIGGEFYLLSRATSSIKALSHSGYGVIVKNVKVFGSISTGGVDQKIVNLRHCESIAFPEVDTNMYPSFYNTGDNCSIDGFTSIPDGFINPMTSGSNGSLFRGSGFSKIINLDYHWYKSSIDLFYSIATRSLFISNVKLDTITGGGLGASVSSCVVQNVRVRNPSNPNPYGVLKQVDCVDQATNNSKNGNGNFYELRFSSDKSKGCMGLWFVKPIDDSVIMSDARNIVLYGSNSGNRFYITTTNDYIIFTWPWKIIGITGFPLDGTVAKYGSVASYTIDYQIDLCDSNGWNGVWLNLDHSNLSMHNISPTGFRFKVRLRRTSGNPTDYLSRLNWTTNVDYDNYPYPDYPVNIILQNIQIGSRWWVYNETSNKVIESGVQSGSDDIIIPDVPYNGTNELLKIRVRKASSEPYYKPFETNAYLTENGATVYVAQEIDTLIGG